MKLLTQEHPPVTQTKPVEKLGWSHSFFRRLFLRSLRGIEFGHILVNEPYLGELTSLGENTDTSSMVCIEVRDPQFFRDIVLRGSVGAGEAWTAGYWDCEDLEGLVGIMLRNRTALDGMGRGIARVGRWFLKRFGDRHSNSKSGSRSNIAAHYDLGNDFFAAFLDSTMTYSCGIFENDDATLQDAQLAKIDRLCERLELAPTDHVLEIGSGWGSFSIRAAQRFGCRVTTTTISAAQYEVATRRVQQAGLGQQVTVLLQDYRDLAGTYDKIASIEMVEAVGNEYLDTWFSVCSRLLSPGGLMAIQAITIADQHFDRAVREVDFIKRYVFPGSFIPSVTRLLNSATKSTDFRLLHMEDFGPHYAETLRRWRHNLNTDHERVRRLGLGSDFLRMWNYYLGYCAGGFDERFLGVAQLLFRRDSTASLR